jgi:hypothetical protein
MSSSYVPVSGETRGGMDYSYLDDEAGYGLVTFAGVMLMIVGILNARYGIAAIDSAHVFVANARYVFGDLNTFGWFVLALGVLQVFAAFAIWRGAPWGRWFGVACACGNAILQMLWIPAYPVLAMTLLGLDIAVLYGLLAYGSRRGHARAARERAAN